MVRTFDTDIDGKRLSIEVGRMAKQAAGSVVVRMQDTMVLVAVCAADEPSLNQDFFPLTVEYRERLYAGGRIPGGFFKREGRLTEKETLGSRLIDRPIRPGFPDGFRNEVQVIASVISADPQIDPEMLAITGASAALSISTIPFRECLAGIRVSRKAGELIAFPTSVDLEESDLDLVVAGTESGVVMVEGSAYEVTEEDLVKAIEFAHERIKKLVALQKQVVTECGKPKRSFTPPVANTELRQAVAQMAVPKILESFEVREKQDRGRFTKQAISEIKAKLASGETDEKKKLQKEKEIAAIYDDLLGEQMRKKILETGTRIGGRKLDEVRPITCEAGVLPRSHGSALFTRGETQALVTTTLGTKLDEQKVENFQGETFKSYMLHYNFPPFSTGEVKRLGGTSRREIGHGNLAERSLAPVLPVVDAFPYTIRVVSDVLESNGSSSMATVCGGSLSLMDAGVLVKTAVAGVAMGLITEGDKVAVLTDILGDEDHYGDMDFKVAGTSEGITAVQMDIKTDQLSFDVLRRALEQARKGRLHIIEAMNQVLREPRKSLSQYAPRIITLKIPTDKIGLLIGPGGKTIRGIQDKTGATITVDDDGTVLIASVESTGGEMARSFVASLTEEEEVGKVYKGRVKNITNFGAFVEILPGKEGLLHISEIAHQRINRVEDVLKPGDEVEVKLISVDDQGKLRLSRKAILPKD